MAKNPYGGGPGTGLTLPPYLKPTKYVKNRNNYFPGTEKVGPDEMRISFVGSCPWPPRHDQAGTCIMVELGNGDIFFFDFGPGCMRNIMAMQVPAQRINDIFITHLHVDHYHDLSYLLPFSAWSGRYKPLRVNGPSGRTSELGIKHMVKGMKEMLSWHLDAFNVCPIGDGYEVDVNEFDFKEENGICYEKNGVTIRHWPRSHAKDGASAYRLDWNGLSFVWTGDGRPDELTVKYAKGVDVFVTECQTDTGQYLSTKYGIPQWLYNYTIDIHHTPHYAVGYMMKEIQPRIGMVTHLEYEEELMNEISAGVRTHWDGLFIIGAPDVMVVNVTKDAIWSRKAALPGMIGMIPPNPQDMFGSVLPKKVTIPQPKIPREEQQIQYMRDIEIDPHKYYPENVYRDPVTKLPDPLIFDVEKMVKARNDLEDIKFQDDDEDKE